MCREEEGIELQVLNRDTKHDVHRNDNNFADFNSIGMKDDLPAAKGGTIGTYNCITLVVFHFMLFFIFLCHKVMKVILY